MPITVRNEGLEKRALEKDWATFIPPDKDLESLNDPAEKHHFKQGVHGDFPTFRGKDPQFDAVLDRINSLRSTMSYEEQCTEKYYFESFQVLKQVLPSIKRVVELGVFQGGLSTFFAGCLQNTDVTYDLIDGDRTFLEFTYERIRRTFPEVCPRIRLFYGNLPAYVKNVMMKEPAVKTLVHHDASHIFNEVLQDLVSLFFVRDRIHGLMIQDTNLRANNINGYMFVDAALYAAFGDKMQYMEIGQKHGDYTNVSHDNKWLGFFTPQHAEGMYIPFYEGLFRYPHPSSKFEEVFEIS